MPYRVIQLSKRYDAVAFESCFIPIGEEFSEKHKARDFVNGLESDGEEFTIIKTYKTYKFGFGEEED